MKIDKAEDRLIEGISSKIDHIRLNGHPQSSADINISFEYIEGESLLLVLI